MLKYCTFCATKEQIINENGAATLSRMNFFGYVGHLTAFS